MNPDVKMFKNPERVASKKIAAEKRKINKYMLADSFGKHSRCFFLRNNLFLEIIIGPIAK